MRIAAVVQARMGSSRFPGKMLADLDGEPLAVRVCRRAARAAGIDAVVLATGDGAEDDPLAAAVAAAGFAVHRGSRDDVLARVLGAARAAGADGVIRITGDCALADPGLIAAAAARLRRGDVAYVSTVCAPRVPDGLDTEAVAVAALAEADRDGRERHHREHVTTFVRERPERFPSAALPSAHGERGDLHWSIDTREDLDTVRALIAAAGGGDPALDALLAAVDRDPALAARCRRHAPNQGAVDAFLADLERQRPRPAIARSDAWWARASGLIPAGTQTLSKGPTQWVRGFAPKYLVRGEGAWVWDADGNRFIDYPLGLGPVTLGHGRREVVEAVARALAEGNAFSLMHPLEVELAERLRTIIPAARGDGAIRFGKNGSDATSACIRAARALTGRARIARHGYHGWQDWSIEAGYGIRAKGVPAEVMALTTAFAYNDLPALERVLAGGEFAAVIMEPVNLTPPAPGYLEGVRRLAHAHGALLIFDEVITGFRYARGGAQEHFGVTPDLCAMGKGVANGMPLAVVAGTAAAMRPFDEIFFSFTFGGETTALAAAMATLDVMEREDYWGHVWRRGAQLQDGFRAIAREAGLLGSHADCHGLPPWTCVVFKDAAPWTALQLKTLFQQEMLRCGVLFSGSQFVSLAHGEAEIDQTLEAYRHAMRVLRTGIDLHAVDRLTLGQVNEVIFRRG